MAKIRFENGTVVNFDGNPTPQDVEEVAQKLGISKGGGFGGAVKSFFTDIKDSAKKRFMSDVESVDRFQKGEQSLGSTLLQTGGQAAGFVSDVAGSLLTRGIQAILPDSLEKKAKDKAIELFSTPQGQAALSAINSGLEAYNAWKAKNPTEAKNIESVVNIASLIPVNKAVELTRKGAKAAATTGKNTLKTAVKTVEASGPVQAVESIAAGTKRIATNTTKRAIETIQEALERSARLKTLPTPEANAIRSGLDEGITNFIKTSNPEDIKVYKQMVDIAKRGTTDLRIASQTKELAGKTILQRADFLVNKLKSTGRKIGKIIDDMPKDEIPIYDQLAEFESTLERLGLFVSEKGKLVNTGTVPSADVSIYQTMYDLIKAGRATPQELHGIRRRVFQELNLAVARQQPFSDTVDQVAEHFRRLLAQPINKLNASYGTLNEEYARAVVPLRDFVKYIGYKGDLEQLNTKSLKVGEIAQRILGNSADRPQSIIDALEDAAVNAGLQVSTSIRDQVRFSDLLEAFYGSPQTRSLKGQVAQAGLTAAEEFAQDTATGGVRGAATNLVKGILGTNKKQQQKALEEFIGSLLQ